MAESQPQPQPKPEPQKAAAKPRPAAAGEGAVPAGADSYTEMPRPPAPKRRWGAVAAGVLAVALAGAWAAKTYAPGAPPAPPPASAEAKILAVSAADMDGARTEALRAALAAAEGAKDEDRGRSLGDPRPFAAAPANLEMPAVQPARAPVPAAPQASPSSLPMPAAAVNPQVAAAVKSGEYGLFQLRLIDNAAMDGDIIAISVDGVPMGRFMLTHGGAILDIPLKPGKRQVVRITGVHDGGGGITLGVQSSLGHVSSRVMAPGDFEEWTVDYR